MKLEELTKEIIGAAHSAQLRAAPSTGRGAAIEVHKALGPGLLEAAYEECPCHEVGLRELAFEGQPSLPVAYKGVKFDRGCRVDIVVEGNGPDWDRPLALPSPRRGEGSGTGTRCRIVSPSL